MLLSSFFILAQANPSPAAGPGGGLFQFLPFIFMGIIFYFLLIRPQQKKAKEHRGMVDSLKTGDRVVTSGGIHGIVSNVKDKTFSLKVADNVKLEVDKIAIAAVETRAAEALPASQS